MRAESSKEVAVRAISSTTLGFFVAVLFLLSLAAPAEAANYTPTLLAPTDGATNVMPDGTTFQWETEDPPDSYIVEWSLGENFRDDDMLFRYSVTDTTYTLNGLPGEKTIYWRVFAVKGDAEYPSQVFSFTTAPDNEGFKLVRLLYDDFTNFDTSVWTITGNTSMLRHSSAGYMEARFWSYYTGTTSYLNTRVTIPGPATLKFKWSHYYYPYYPNDSLTVEYSTDGSSYSTITKLSGSAFDSGQRSVTSPGPWKTTEVPMPVEAYGKNIYLRFKFYSGWGPNAYLDEVEISYKKFERKLTVYSDYGEPDPSGEIIYESGQRVTATAPEHAFQEGVMERRYYCSGWTGTGSVPAVGEGNVCSFLIFRTSTLRWTWEVEYRVIVSSTNDYGNPDPSGINYYLKGSEVTFRADLIHDTGSPDERYALKGWSGTGCCSGSGTENEITFTVDSPGTLTWKYKRQFRLTIVSAHAGSGFDPPLGVNWFFENSVVLATCPDFLDTGGGVGYIYAGYSAEGGVLPGQLRPVVISMRGPITFTWEWTQAFNLSIITARGEIHGTAPGWYEVGTLVSTSMDEYVPTEDENVRWHCTGWEASGSVASGSGHVVPDFTLDDVTTITWQWERQFYCIIDSNVGTVAPSSGWFSEGLVMDISTTPPPDTEDTRYYFNQWNGSGDGSYTGPDVEAVVTVHSPLVQHAVWNIEYRLVVIAVNGALASDPSGWYLKGTSVSITAVPPQAGDGERWRARWLGTGEGSVDIPASATSPPSVTVQMNGPILQRVEWLIQYSLTVFNPEGFGFTDPAPGTYWYFDGELATGYCSYADGDHMCAGFEATGSSTGGATPYYRIVVHEPTTVTWLWGDRPAQAAENWAGFSTIAGVESGPLAMLHSPAGDLLVYFYSAAGNSIERAVLTGDTWAVATFLANVGEVTDIAAHKTGNAVDVVFRRSDPPGLYRVRDDSFLLKPDEVTGGPAPELIADTGVRPSVASSGDTVWVSWFDVRDASLKVAHTTGGGWEIETVDANDGAGFFNAIAIPPHDELPVVVYARSGGAKGLYWARFNGEYWETGTIVPEFAGYFCSMALDAAGVPFVAYQSLDEPDHSTLHVARYWGGGWDDEVVDDEGDTGYYTSIVVDGAGYPHVAYTDGENLRYARNTPGGWETRTLVRGGVDGPTGITFDGAVPAVSFVKNGKVSYIDASGRETSSSGGGGTTTVTGGGGGGCFIATAAFGSLSASEVKTLTALRDASGLASRTGAGLVSLYYSVSPAPAAGVRGSESLRALLRRLLR